MMRTMRMMMIMSMVMFITTITIKIIIMIPENINKEENILMIRRKIF